MKNATRRPCSSSQVRGRPAAEAAGRPGEDLQLKPEGTAAEAALAEAAGTAVKSLADYYDALTKAIPNYTRATTRAEAMLEGEWAGSLRPLLTDTYRGPLFGGAADHYGESQRKLERWIRNYLKDRTGLIDGLHNNLSNFAGRSFNLGGQMGLNHLDLQASFELQDQDIQDDILNEMGKLSEVNGKMSLTRTTARELARELKKHADNDLPFAEAAQIMGTWILARTVIRTAVVAMTENVKMNRWGMATAFVGNGVRAVIHECEWDVHTVCTTGVCPPLCGEEFQLGGLRSPLGRISGGNRIPLHPGCRCQYNAVMDGWVKPAVIWAGMSLD
jgi:hypothetical protein